MFTGMHVSDADLETQVIYPYTVIYLKNCTLNAVPFNISDDP